MDTSGQEFTSSPGPGFNVDVIIATSGKRRLLNKKWFDLGDGTFMCLYFFNQQPNEIIIKVLK